MAAKKKEKRQKFIIRDKSTKEVICGIRFDKEKNEFLIGGPKTKAEERDKLIKMLDLDTGETEKEVVEDGFRSRIRVAVDERTWNDFVRRASRLYLWEEVKSFKRLMN